MLELIEMHMNSILRSSI